MAKPFLRWAGGKRWLAPKLGPLIKQTLEGTYYEVFLGGAALFFNIAPERAVLSDINEGLIDAYRVAEEFPDELIEALKSLRLTKKEYYRIRNDRPWNRSERAVRFVYLNRTCYGGLYRTNRKGDFNVPFGGGSRTPKPLWEKGLLQAASKTLQMSDIRYQVSDFQEVMEQAKSGDVVYCDPTYARTKREQFDRYNNNIFRWEDQSRLAKTCYRALDRGVLVIVSNTYCKDVRDLYPSAYRICIERNKAIGNKAKNGNTGLEYLIILDPERRRRVWKTIGNIERIKKPIADL